MHKFTKALAAIGLEPRLFRLLHQETELQVLRHSGL